jgi:hypothetical protein
MGAQKSLKADNRFLCLESGQPEVLLHIAHPDCCVSVVTSLNHGVGYYRNDIF